MTIDERNQLVLENMNLVYHVAKKFFVHPSAYYSYEDLVQEGIIGFIKAIDRFDPSKGYELSTYAVPMIKGSIRRFIRDNIGYLHVPRSAMDEYFNYMREIREDESLSDMSPIAREVFYSFNPIFLDSRLGDDRDDPEYASIISSPSDDYGTDDIEEIIEIICNSNFTDNQQDIIYEYYFGKYLGADISQSSLGKKYHVSQVSVSRILSKFEKLLEQYLYVDKKVSLDG